MLFLINCSYTLGIILTRYDFREARFLILRMSVARKLIINGGAIRPTGLLSVARYLYINGEAMKPINLCSIILPGLWANFILVNMYIFSKTKLSRWQMPLVVGSGAHLTCINKCSCHVLFSIQLMYSLNEFLPQEVHMINMLKYWFLVLTPGKLPEQFGGVAWLDVTYSVAGGDLFGGSTWLNQIW